MVNGERCGKKQPCPDCSFCQWCGDDRCQLCRGRCATGGKKLSLAEQIALYETINGRGKEISKDEG
jgi:hypothetical protein